MTPTAVVGLGGIGSGMARRLIDADFQVTVYNRTPEKAADLVEAGARHAPTLAEVAGTDVILLSLSDEFAVEQVLFGGLVPHLRPGTVVVDTSTVSPAYARDAAARLASAGVGRVEACVIGNPTMAKSGELRVFAAGDAEAFGTAKPVLSALSRQGILHLGEAGRASAMKLAFNLLLGAQTAALGEAVAFAESAGLDREFLLTAIQKSGWRSPVLNFRAEFMRTKRYDPAGFRADLMAKDIGLALGEAATKDLDLPLIECVARRFADVQEAGLGGKDAAVVVDVPARAPVSEPGPPVESG